MNTDLKSMRKLASLIKDVNGAVAVQRDRLEDTSAAMEHVADSASQASIRVRELSESAQSSSASAATGEQEVEGAVGSIDSVRDTIVLLKEAMSFSKFCWHSQQRVAPGAAIRRARGISSPHSSQRRGPPWRSRATRLCSS